MRAEEKETTMSNATLVREWSSDAFHNHVLELESRGYNTRRETYQIVADTNPETGEVIHLYTVEMYKPNDEAD
jgi:hypothetical protein